MTSSQIDPHRAKRVDHFGLAALDTGPGPDSAVVLVPGYTGSKEDFVPLLDPMAQADWRAVAVDLSGQHESPGPDTEDAYRPGPLADPVVRLVAELRADHRRVVLMGHSFGGLVARAAVLAGAPVAGLTLLCSGPAALPPGERHVRLDLAEALLRDGSVEAVQALREAAEPIPEPPELAAFMRSRFLRTSPVSLLGMADVLRTEPDRTADLRAVLADRGSLVVCGKGDDAWPVDVQRDMAARLGAPFELVPASTHTPNTENPLALLEILLRHWETWR